MDIKEETYQFLSDLGIQYEQAEHASIPTMEALDEVSTILGCPIAKNLLLTNRQKTKFYLLLMPGDKKFKTKELSKQINSARLSFADDETMFDLLHIHSGSLSPLGLMQDSQNKIQLLIDEDIMDWEYIGMHPCDNTATLKIAKNDFIVTILKAIHHDYQVVHLVGEDSIA